MKTTPNQIMNQAFVVSKLLEEPKRFNDLWEAVKSQVRSKDTFVHTLDSLRELGLIERIEKSRKHVVYKISSPSPKSYIVSLARRISLSGSVELVKDCMEWLVQSGIFENKEEGIQAAVDFWIVRYRNLCVLDALSSLPLFKEGLPNLSGQEALQNFTLLRKMYQEVENKFFEVLLRFTRNYPEASSIVRNKLFLKGVDLKASWLTVRLKDFLEKYYPIAFEKLDELDKAKIYFELLAKEREKEYFTCEKYNRELPRGICRLCELGDIDCKYRKIPSTREKIRQKRKQWPNDWRSRYA